MLRGIHHVGIAVKNLDEATQNYKSALGVKVQSVHEVPDPGLRIAMLPVENSIVELIQPTGTEGTIAEFIASNGEGVNHICFEVDDIKKELAALSAKGIPLRDKESRQGVVGKIAFLSPEGMNGVTIELVEKTSAV
ncbi:methylmalonyl-CoA epimerase [Chloroflexota bacterium]